MSTRYIWYTSAENKTEQKTITSQCFDHAIFYRQQHQLVQSIWAPPSAQHKVRWEVSASARPSRVALKHIRVGYYWWQLQDEQLAVMQCAQIYYILYPNKCHWAATFGEPRYFRVCQDGRDCMPSDRWLYMCTCLPVHIHLVQVMCACAYVWKTEDLRKKTHKSITK